MSPRSVLFLAAACVASMATAQSDPVRTLKVGMDAPSISLGKAIKGPAFGKIEKGKVTAFVAFALRPITLNSVPIINDLAKNYSGKAAVQGVCIWYQDAADAEKFLNDNADKIGFPVALDSAASKEGSQGAFDKDWLKASGFDRSPTVFIVDQEGKLAWAGLPVNAEAPLRQIVDGKWDRAKFADQLEKVEFSPLNLALRREATLVENQMFDEALKLCDKIAGMASVDSLPDPKVFAASERLNIIIKGKGDEKAWYTEARIASEGALKDDGPSLNNIAWEIVDPKGLISNKDKDFALKCALRAVDLTKRKDGNILDTLAWTYALIGDRAKAIAVEKEALGCELDADTRAKFEENLKTLRGE